MRRTARSSLAPSNSSWQVLSSTRRKLIGRLSPASVDGNSGNPYTGMTSSLTHESRKGTGTWEPSQQHKTKEHMTNNQRNQKNLRDERKCTRLCHGSNSNRTINLNGFIITITDLLDKKKGAALQWLLSFENVKNNNRTGRDRTGRGPTLINACDTHFPWDASLAH